MANFANVLIFKDKFQRNIKKNKIINFSNYV